MRSITGCSIRDGGGWICTHSEQSGWTSARPPCGPSPLRNAPGPGIWGITEKYRQFSVPASFAGLSGSIVLGAGICTHSLRSGWFIRIAWSWVSPPVSRAYPPAQAVSGDCVWGRQPDTYHTEQHHSGVEHVVVPEPLWEKTGKCRSSFERIWQWGECVRQYRESRGFAIRSMFIGSFGELRASLERAGDGGGVNGGIAWDGNGGIGRTPRLGVERKLTPPLRGGGGVQPPLPAPPPAWRSPRILVRVSAQLCRKKASFGHSGRLIGAPGCRKKIKKVCSSLDPKTALLAGKVVGGKVVGDLEKRVSHKCTKYEQLALELVTGFRRVQSECLWACIEAKPHGLQFGRGVVSFAGQGSTVGSKVCRMEQWCSCLV
eukprot:gene22076-biopygen16227